MKTYTFIIAILLAFFGGSTSAEEAPVEDPTIELSNMMEAMSAMAMMDAYANPMMAATLQASYCRNLYDGLQENGFTKEQAMKIVIAQCNLKNLLLPK